MMPFINHQALTGLIKLWGQPNSGRRRTHNYLSIFGLTEVTSPHLMVREIITKKSLESAHGLTDNSVGRSRPNSRLSKFSNYSHEHSGLATARAHINHPTALQDSRRLRFDLVVAVDEDIAGVLGHPVERLFPVVIDLEGDAHLLADALDAGHQAGGEVGRYVFRPPEHPYPAVPPVAAAGGLPAVLGSRGRGGVSKLPV